MNSIIVILVLLVIIAVMGGIIYFLIKGLKSKKAEIQNLNNRLESAKINIEQLSAFVDKLLEIKTDEKSVSEKIKEAETDEEVFNIIAGIVNSNNNRVQNSEG